MQKHLVVTRAAALCMALAGALIFANPASAQSVAAGPPDATAGSAKPNAAVVPTPPPGYVIGPEDVLSIYFWREKDLSGDVIVRPDGRISLPLMNEFEAAGLTPDQLREKIMAVADKYIQDPNLTILVKQINSRRVYITGMVNKSGPYSLMAPTTVVQLIAMAGGLQDYAHKNKIVVMRNENGKSVSYRFNYEEVIDGKNLKQNIELKPGDTVIVP
jgi:polysaccharide export outer membrane protein